MSCPPSNNGIGIKLSRNIVKLITPNIKRKLSAGMEVDMELTVFCIEYSAPNKGVEDRIFNKRVLLVYKTKCNNRRKEISNYTR